MEREKLYVFLKKYIEEATGFLEMFSLQVLHVAKGEVKAEIELNESLCNPAGTIHGGCLFTLADSVGGTAAMTHGSYVTTTTGHISYLNPAFGRGKLRIEAKEIKAGKTLLTYDVFFFDEEDKLICKATMEYYALEEIGGSAIPGKGGS